MTRHVGVGTVTLRVKKRNSKRGSRNTSILILEDVLYIPGSFCNLIGNPILDEYNFHNDYKRGKDGAHGFYDKHGRGRVAILDRPHLWRLRLTGQSATETILDADGAYGFFTHWPASERERWQRVEDQQFEGAQCPTFHRSCRFKPYSGRKNRLGEGFGDRQSRR